MRLKDIVGALDCKALNMKDIEVSGISYDSRNVAEGALFVAVPGEHTDGHKFIKDALLSGAGCVMTQKPAEVKAPQIIVPDIRAALSRVSDLFYGEPSRRIIMVGVTGTNGKTTTTYILESIFTEAGFNPGVIGTVNYRYGGRVFDAPHTTPQAPELHRTLREMVINGVTHCVMEVSSHSLAQKRVADCRFNAGVFTNLTHEHLDYHKTMDEYFRCKSILFTLLKGSSGLSIINIDDPWGEVLKKDRTGSITYSLKAGAMVFPKESLMLEDRTEATIVTPGGVVRASSNLVGGYNLQNILAATAAAYALGIDCESIGRGISALRRVPGRLEKIESTGVKRFRAYVDYAHTGDALERALTALRVVSPCRIITVFGCGGNRDRLKRPEMGEISARLSDVSIITSDNPRDEDPDEIIKEIEAGIRGIRKYSAVEDPGDKGYMVIPERAEAIRQAVSLARSGDTILVAGKGHEDYQIIKGKKFKFDDIEVLNGAIEELCNSGTKTPREAPRTEGRAS